MTHHLDQPDDDDHADVSELRHGADGFTSPPKELVLRIFIALGRV
jgi:hypothetical protein